MLAARPRGPIAGLIYGGQEICLREASRVARRWIRHGEIQIRKGRNERFRSMSHHAPVSPPVIHASGLFNPFRSRLASDTIGAVHLLAPHETL
jgi:hypothetical protein